MGLDYWRNEKKNLVLSLREDGETLFFHDYEGHEWDLTVNDFYSLITSLEMFQ